LLPLHCRVLYKLDRTGNSEEFCVADLPNCTGLPLSGFTSDQFLQLCVMAGCDFLAQLPGIGLKKAHGVLRKYRSFTKVPFMVIFECAVSCLSDDLACKHVLPCAAGVMAAVVNLAC
jgi:5'-3' exonuclease